MLAFNSPNEGGGGNTTTIRRRGITNLFFLREVMVGVACLIEAEWFDFELTKTGGSRSWLKTEIFNRPTHPQCTPVAVAWSTKRPRTSLMGENL